jgi:autotransporter passenger strand-loop-strand repeat protein
VVSNGGVQLVGFLFGGGTATATASATVVDSGGLQAVLTDGVTSHTTVSSGGTELVAAGGTAYSTTVASSGTLTIDGTVSGATVLSGGIAVVSAGGTLDVLAGNTVAGATVMAGGFEYVSSGGKIDGATISGGTLVLSSGSNAGQSTIVFAGGGTLEVDASKKFAAAISGFGVPDHIDLADIAFGPKTTLGFTEAANNLSGTLTVSDGTNTAHILLLGQYLVGQFTSASDGHVGTLIGDPPLAPAGEPGPVSLAPSHRV